MHEPDAGIGTGGALSPEAEGGSDGGGALVASGGAQGGTLQGEAGVELPPAEGGAAMLPLIGSGTRYCDNDYYCFGLDCYVPPPLEARICVQPCERDADCQVHEVCLQGPELEPGCYSLCDSPRDCNYGFDCFDFANQQSQLVCFPTSWAAYWQQHHL